MKRIVLSLVLSIPLAMQAAGDRKVAYFNDMAKPVKLRIVPEAAPSKPLTIEVQPQKYIEVPIPGGRIAELTIEGINSKGEMATETLFARSKDLSWGSKDPLFEKTFHYGHNATLNKDARYVITTNDYSPNRDFRLLNPGDIELLKSLKSAKETVQGAASKAGSAAVKVGGVLVDVSAAAGKGAIWFLTVAALGN